jgi:hypothetical protein
MAVVAGDVLAMAPRKLGAELIAHWTGRSDLDAIAARLQKGTLIVHGVTHDTAERVVERLHQIGIQARAVAVTSLRRSWLRRLFGLGPVLAYVMGVVAAILLHPVALAGGVAAGAILAATRGGTPQPLVPLATIPALPPGWDDLVRSRNELDLVERAAVDEILHGCVDILTRVAAEGLTVDPGAGHGMGRAIARVLVEAAGAAERVARGDAEVAQQLTHLAQAVTQARTRMAPVDAGPSPEAEAEEAEKQLLREADFVREVCSVATLDHDIETGS